MKKVIGTTKALEKGGDLMKMFAEIAGGDVQTINEHGGLMNEFGAFVSIDGEKLLKEGGLKEVE